jgi:transposase
MTEKDTELSRRLVVGHKRDGRCRYDEDAKRELIEACLQPGVSVARMALLHGVNANLLRTWMGKYQRHRGATDGGQTAVAALSAFVPVVEAKTPARPAHARIGALLPNGIKLDLSDAGLDELSSILRLLGTLPCSGSTRG